MVHTSSCGAPEDAADPLAVLAQQRRAWDSRPFLRELYREWFEDICALLAPGDGPTVELGCGIGAFKQLRPTTIATDLFATPWADAVVDAERMPFAAASVANLVAIDVIHHLPRPARCFEEAVRVLRPGGRFVMVEPYCSPLSTPLYRAFHHERTDLAVDPFAEQPHSSDRPFDSNQALPTLLFWRRLAQFEHRHPQLAVIARKRFATVRYPLSGGLTKRPLIPRPLRRPAARIERALRPLAPLAAFRCLVALERRHPAAQP
jgi:SAM-dependent methyltransferase